MLSELHSSNSKHPLNPNAEPFYLVPRQLFFLPQQHTTIFSSTSCSFGFYPLNRTVNEATSEPTHVNVKMGSINRRVPQKMNFPNKGYERKRTVAKMVRSEWKVKAAKGKLLDENSTTPRRTVIPFPNTIEEAVTSPITTVMIRNVPNQYKLDDLLLIMDDHCWQQNKTIDDPGDWSKFDFVYLPMDFRKHAIEGRMSNLGYAFVNFTTPSAAFKFYEQFQGLVWNVTENQKICEINAALYQGKDTLMRIFRQKVFQCKSRDLLPVVFSEARDGLNRQIEGTPVGKHVPGLPRRSIGTRAYFQNH